MQVLNLLLRTSGMKAIPYLIAAWLAAQSLSVLAWVEQQTMEFIMAHNPVFRSYRIATAEYAPATDTMGRMLEYTSLYGRAGSAVFRSTSFVVHRLNTSREMLDCLLAASSGGHRAVSWTRWHGQAIPAPWQYPHHVTVYSWPPLPASHEHRSH